MVYPENKIIVFIKSTLIMICVIAAISGAVHVIFLLTKLTSQLGQMTVKLDKLDTMTAEIKHLNSRLNMLEETNNKLTRMEGYMRFMPVLAEVGEIAVAESSSANRKLDITNDRLAKTNLFMRDSTNKLNATNQNLQFTNGNLKGMRSNLSQMGDSIDLMAAQLPVLNDMNQQLTQTNSKLSKTTESIEQVARGVNKVGSGLDIMQLQLKDMDAHFKVLPEMKLSLDKTNEMLAVTTLTFQPLSQCLPELSASVQQMNLTTQDMARSMKRLPNQGALGIGVLTSAILFRK